MRRGTAPTITFSVEHIDLSLMKAIIITFEQDGEEVLTKTGDDLTSDDGTAKLTLTQEETLKLKRGYVDIQLKAMTDAGTVWATKIKQKHVDEILDESVMT